MLYTGSTESLRNKDADACGRSSLVLKFLRRLLLSVTLHVSSCGVRCETVIVLKIESMSGHRLVCPVIVVASGMDKESGRDCAHDLAVNKFGGEEATRHRRETNSESCEKSESCSSTLTIDRKPLSWARSWGQSPGLIVVQRCLDLCTFLSGKGQSSEVCTSPCTACQESRENFP